jgi:hypothetical protein
MATKPKKPSKAAAAKAEKESTQRSVEWEGLTIALPPELPEAVLLDLALVQGGDDPTSTFEMLMTMIGEGQLRLVRNKLKTDEKVGLDNVAELIGQIFAEYGTSEGESEASQDS